MKLEFFIFIIALYSVADCLTLDEWKKNNPDAYLKATQLKSSQAISAAYKENEAKISKHNSNKTASYKMVANSNAAYTEKERMKLRKGYKVKQVANQTSSSPDSDAMKKRMSSTTAAFKTTTTKKTSPPKKGKREISMEENHARFARAPIPDTLDYTPKMTAVKDQKNCGASWAFAANAVMEYHSIVNATNYILSEQNLIDCDVASSG